MTSADQGTERDRDREEEHAGPKIHDRRRIDPQTYQVREPQETAAPAGSTAPVDAERADAGQAAPSESDEVATLTTRLAERTEDLQRLQAEYVNYKRRVDRDRDLSRKLGVESVLRELLSVLDNIAAARSHGELTGGFKAVAEDIEKVAAAHGLESFGAAGDPFDPTIHEALMHAASAEPITVATCVQILQPGYRIGDRILRPARVAVAEPDPGAASAAPAPDAEATTAPDADATTPTDDGPATDSSRS